MSTEVFVVTPTRTLRLSSCPRGDSAEAIAARKWALATPIGSIFELRRCHGRRSKAKFGAPTIAHSPPNPEMAQIPLPRANKQNQAEPALRRVPRSGL